MRSKLTLALTLLVLATGTARADDMASGSVKFLNESKRPIQLTTKASSDDNCLRSADLQKITIEPGQSSEATAGANLCYCLGQVRRNSCTSSWTLAKAGSTVRLR
jgi:hypothetical protein